MGNKIIKPGWDIRARYQLMVAHYRGVPLKVMVETFQRSQSCVNNALINYNIRSADKKPGRPKSKDRTTKFTPSILEDLFRKMEISSNSLFDKGAFQKIDGLEVFNPSPEAKKLFELYQIPLEPLWKKKPGKRGPKPKGTLTLEEAKQCANSKRFLERHTFLDVLEYLKAKGKAISCITTAGQTFYRLDQKYLSQAQVIILANKLREKEKLSPLRLN